MSQREPRALVQKLPVDGEREPFVLVGDELASGETSTFICVPWLDSKEIVRLRVTQRLSHPRPSRSAPLLCEGPRSGEHHEKRGVYEDRLESGRVRSDGREASLVREAPQYTGSKAMDDPANQASYYEQYSRKNQMPDHYPIGFELVNDSADDFMKAQLGEL